MIKVFVYGTLRKGEGNHRLLAEATCLAEQCWTEGQLYDTGFGYPAMKISSSTYVYGELYSITESELNRLEQLEGYRVDGENNLYNRIQQTVYTDSGKVVAFMYVANKETLLRSRISNGDWKEYRLLAETSDSILYFAYGSCMDEKRFIKDGFVHYFQNMIGVGELTNYTLRFTRKSSIDRMGRADIVEEGGRVEGKVYRIPIKALKEYLYAREGAPKAYRFTFVSIELNGKKVLAVTFVVTNKNGETAPPTWYEEEILRGANGFLTEEYMSNIQSHINALRNRGGIE